MIPEELQILLDVDDDDDLRIYIDNSDFSKVEPVINFNLIVHKVDEEINERWKLLIKGHRVSNVFSETSYQLKILD